VRRTPSFLVSLLLLAATSGCANQLMLHPWYSRSRIGESPQFPATQFTEVVVQNSRGFKLRAALYYRDGDRGTVMVSGGNATSRRQTAQYFRFLLGHGFRMLAFSFQGYDDNEGKAELTSLVGDATAFYQYLEKAFPGEPIAYVANSISSAPAFCLPTIVDGPVAIAVEGAFIPKSIPYSRWNSAAYAVLLYPVFFPIAALVSVSIPRNLDVESCIARDSTTPILFIHHPDDSVTPFRDARRLFDLYRGEKQLLIPSKTEPQAHANLGDDANAQRALVEFLILRVQGDHGS